jgi:hypothetical protein
VPGAPLIIAKEFDLDIHSDAFPLEFWDLSPVGDQPVTMFADPIGATA